MKAIVNLAEPSNVLVCAPNALEFGFSTRNGKDHTELMKQLGEFADCDVHPTAQDALSIQNRLWNGSLVRAAGAMDTAIAAYAIKNQATLVHYDRDFEHIAKVESRLKHQWIVPRGSIT
jgi:predicted nucleic acid-binding protein